MLYKRNLNKRYREPLSISIGIIIFGIALGTTVLTVAIGSAIAFSIYFLVNVLSMRPDVTIPVIYPD